MATATSSTDLFTAPVIDPIEDLALRTPERDRDREMNMEILRRQGYEVTLFKSNRAFFDHIKQDPSRVDLLVIADHGNPTRVGDLRVKDESIVSHDSNLTEEERVNGFQNLRPILNKDSILLFHACLAGNKTVENNIARVASRILPQTDVYACQYLTLYEPGFEYKLDEDKGVVIDTINYGFAGTQGEDALGLVKPAIYRNGEELTGQPAAALPPPRSNPRRFSRCNPYVVGALAVAAIAAIVGIGAWYYSKAS
jgi:hypothetical protein